MKFTKKAIVASFLIVFSMPVILLFQNCSKTKFAQMATFSSLSVTCSHNGTEYQNGESFADVIRNRTRAGSCPAETVTYDLSEPKKCLNGVVEPNGTPNETNYQYSGVCGCGLHAQGELWTDTMVGGSSTTGSCNGKTLIRDIQQDKTCNAGSAVNIGIPRLVNPREIGACIFLPCGTHAHGDSWSDTVIGGNTTPGSCVGKTLVRDIVQDKSCNNGTVTNIGPQQLVSPREIGSCTVLGCGLHAHGDSWTDITPDGSSTPGSCVGKTLLRDVAQDKTCSNGSASNVGPQRLVNPREIGTCTGCGSHLDGDTWSETTVGGNSTPGSCVGKTLIRDVVQDKVCSNGTANNVGAQRLVSPREVGFCNCGSRPHGATWSDTVVGGRTAPGSCNGKTKVYDTVQDKICADGSANNVGVERLINERETGTCTPLSCGANPHGSTWTVTTPRASSTPGSCLGKTLIRDSEQDQTCNNGVPTNVGGLRLVNGREEGECIVDPAECSDWDGWSPDDERAHPNGGTTHYHCQYDHDCSATGNALGLCREVECINFCCQQTGRSCCDRWRAAGDKCDDP